MTVASRTRSATRWGLKMQRRIALAQALFWPLLLSSGLVLAVVGLFAVRRARPGRTATPPTPAPVATDGAPTAGV
ncbi:hypothetical protein Mycch_0273 [Mycolicibacterium chubuense NBB4]|uniref:Uncharacterized protein n=1 Tax=Mycolicibacterium chubuense (strain NBB4) TaxID=710421 RepID=I4BCU1_MYCCN|nr:hypothetical protein [Mycolicibacterium chubuense]AFM15098.1 hypothetical protein Mycch_0273 [Mycolicibacterium chubuense NBB4]